MPHAALLHQQSAPAPAQALPGLPILSSLLQLPVYEPGPLGPWQEWGAVYGWPEAYPHLEQVVTLLA